MPAWAGLTRAGNQLLLPLRMELPQVWTGQTTGRVDRRKRMFSKAPYAPLLAFILTSGAVAQSAHGLEMSSYVGCKRGHNETGEQTSHHLSGVALPGGKMPRSDQTVAFSQGLFLCPLKLSAVLPGGFHKLRNFASCKRAVLLPCKWVHDAVNRWV